METQDLLELDQPEGKYIESNERTFFVGTHPAKFKVAPGLADQLIDIHKLAPHPQNYNNGDIEAIAFSLDKHGQYRSIVVNIGTYSRRYPPGTVAAGNHTYAGAMQNEWTHIGVDLIDVNDDELTDILVIDNHLARKAWTDDAQLAAILEEKINSEKGVTGTGFSYDEAQAFIDEQRRKSDDDEETPEDADEVPDKLGEVVSVAGDIWKLGSSYIMCGDAGDKGDVDALFAVVGEKASLFWTDPPWGVSYVGKTRKALTIQNDTADDTAALCFDAFSAAVPHLVERAPFYVVHPAGNQAPVMWRVIMELGWKVHQNLVWNKDSMVLGHSDYHFKHESVVFGYLPGSGRVGRGHKYWYGPDNAVSVHDVARPKASREHPTTKPVDLIIGHMKNSLRKNELVYDSFGGSGSTLIAAELSGRRAAIMEVDPAYVDVVCRRYQRQTGRKPVHALTNEERSFPDNAE